MSRPFWKNALAKVRQRLTFKPSTKRPRVRLRLECLEDRLVLATRTWDGGAVSNNWTNANNWAGNVAPVTGDDLVFPSNVADKTADNNFAGGTLFNSITLGGGYTLRGNQIRLGSGGIIDNSSTSNVIKNDINLGTGTSPQVFQVGAGSTLFIDGKIDGSKELRKTGAGDLSFRANNSYSGLTDIQAGRLFIEKDESLGAFTGAGTGTLIHKGASLLINDQALGTIRTDEQINIEDGGTLRALNDVELRGPLGTSGTATLRHDGGSLERLLVTGQISGPGGVTIANGSGKVVFQQSNANTYLGLTTVAGELRLDNSLGNAVVGNITVNSTGILRLEGEDQIGDNATVTINGGILFGEGNDDAFQKLHLIGGTVDGSALTGLDSSFDINEVVATSSSVTQSAEVRDVFITLTVVFPVTVTDGPAFNDFVVKGFMATPFLNEFNRPFVRLTGGGTMLVQAQPARKYEVDTGLLRLHRFEREGIFRLLSDIDVAVTSGGSFAGDVPLRNLSVHNGGRVRPGTLSAPGLLEIDGNLTTDPGAIFEFFLNGTEAGVSHDQIQVAGEVDIDGAILEPRLGPNASVNQQYRIIDNLDTDPIDGQFAVPPETAPFQIVPETGQRLAFNYTGGTSANDLVLTLQNTPPMAPGLALDRTELDEGSFVTATGHLVDPDPGARLRLLINWGDGTSVQTFRPGRADFSYRHRYLEDGDYVASFVWLDQFGQGNNREFAITVNNVPPQALLDLSFHATSPVLHADFMFLDPGADALVLTVDYGDGAPTQTHTVGRRRTFALKHRFERVGTFNLTFTLRDGDGGVTTVQRQVVI
jgi:autotransporter-associated beta strand protein